jgi:hypothetical protein
MRRGHFRQGGKTFASARLWAVALAGLLTCFLLPTVAAAGPLPSITGKAIDAVGKAGLEGIWVCAEENGAAEDYACDETEEGGEYSISSIDPGSYRVRFSDFNSGSYLPQYYNGESSYESADLVSVVAGVTTPNIDAEMYKGGGITGTVVDAASEDPLEGVEVCAFLGSAENSSRCTDTESDGTYVLRPLETGSYKVRFTPEYNDHVHVKQFFDDQPSRSIADSVSVTAGSTTPEIDAAMHEGGKVTGTVTKAAGGAPVEGISVCAVPASYGSEYSSTCGSTNTAGNYTISGLAAGSYRIQFYGGVNYLTQYYNGATESQATFVSVDSEATTPGIDAHLQEAGQIKGKVVDAVTKVPLSSAEVCAIKIGGSGYQPTTCGFFLSDGEYTIGGLPSGSYKVRFNPGYGEIAPGEYGTFNYVTQFYKGKPTEAAGEAVGVTAGSATTGIDAELQTGGKISGTVRAAQGNAPLKNVEVCAAPVIKRASPGGCTHTNSSGEYTINRLATGSYRLKFQPGYEQSGFLVQYYSDQANKGAADPVSVTAGSTTPNIDADLHEGGKISGTVVDASGKAPLSGISVCARYNCATTNSAGEYTIQGLPTAFYKVRFSPGYESSQKNYIAQYYDGKATSEGADEVSVTAGATTANIDAELHAGGKISGTVDDALSHAPLEEIEVCAYGNGAEKYEFTSCTRSGESGDYVLEGLTGGRYRVGFFAGGAYSYGETANRNYLSQYYDGKEDYEAGDPVSVTPGSTTPNIDAEMHEGGKIAGTVTGAPGAVPQRYAEVCAFSAAGGEEEFGRCALSDEDGHYVIEGLASGSYTVSFGVFTPGFESPNYLRQYYQGQSSAEDATAVPVTVGSTTSSIDAELQVGGQIKGRVVSAADGVPLSGVSVCALSSGDEEFGSCAQTNNNGEYAISGLNSGSYTVKFSAINYEYEEGFYEEEFNGEEEFKTQYYNGKSSGGQANPVSVIAGSATTGIDASLVEATSALVRPLNTEAPLLSGEAVVGETLSCSPGIWSGGPSGYSYRWLRDGVEIFGKVGSSYEVQAADQSHEIACRVTASNSKGSTSANSNQLSVPAGGGGGTQFALVVSLAGTGSGSVTSSPAGVNCGVACSHSFAAGTSVSLTAAPSPGSAFAGWSGSSCSGTGVCHISLNQASSVTATFSPESSGGGGAGGGANPGAGGGGGSSSVSGSPVPAPAAPRPSSPHCKRGFKKTKVKGKERCVKLKSHNKNHRKSH